MTAMTDITDWNEEGNSVNVNMYTTSDKITCTIGFVNCFLGVPFSIGVPALLLCILLRRQAVYLTYYTSDFVTQY